MKPPAKTYRTRCRGDKCTCYHGYETLDEALDALEREAATRHMGLCQGTFQRAWIEHKVGEEWRECS